MAAYLILCLGLTIIGVAFDAISDLLGSLVESYKQRRFETRKTLYVLYRAKEEKAMTLQEQVTMMVGMITQLNNRLMAYEMTQCAAPAGYVAPAPTHNVPDAPFAYNVQTDDKTDVDTVVTTPAAHVRQESTRRYKIPARLAKVSRPIDNVIYNWVGRSGQTVYGVSLSMSDNGTVYAQVIDAATLKPKSRCVVLPERAKRIGPVPAINNAKQTPAAAPPVAPTSPQQESYEPTEKPFIVYHSKKSGLMARDDNGYFMVADATDTAHTVRMIRRGYVPAAVTDTELNSLIQDNPKHWPSK